MLKLKVGGKLLDFLYDLGSQVSMFPKHIYDRLDQKSTLCPINKSGVRIFSGWGNLPDHCNEIRQRIRVFNKLWTYFGK